MMAIMSVSQQPHQSACCLALTCLSERRRRLSFAKARLCSRIGCLHPSRMVGIRSIILNAVPSNITDSIM